MLIVEKDTNTVFVIGAGASEEAKLPTGNELKKRIAQLLDIDFEPFRQVRGDQFIVSALRLLVGQSGGSDGDIQLYLKEAWHIRDALPQAISIDNFIDTHRDNDKIAICGKLAIVRSILMAEKKSLLYFEKTHRDSNINFNALIKTWYTPFFQLLTENCGKSDLKERLKSITLIIFNYDRCVEHFIYCSLQNYYRISGDEAGELIKSINIYHPYGIVGSLPWVNNSGPMEFGAELNSAQLLELAHKIKTFAEGTDPDSSDILKIRRHMSLANRLVFLGFAFHKLNMQLILPERSEAVRNIEVKCFATTKDISDSDKEVIEEQIDDLYPGRIRVKMTNRSCSEFFTEFWRSLAF